MKGWTYEDAVPADLTDRNSASSYVLFFMFQISPFLMASITFAGARCARYSFFM